ncbi:hypothetical protein SAY86_030265 [Trapa natans]|uniref:Legume lectin domain-containing protein n=1 Tax=Trapa natans TaxID=22666 RepID=A0AAN7M4X8_TRANT|nr:hypothetical protein SAY86_030265 [Trapa natans]
MSPPPVLSSFLGLLIFASLGALSADPTSPSFSFLGFEQDTASIVLFGGSRVVGGGSAIELSGLAVFNESIRVVHGNPQSLASFSTNFTFSLFSGGGDGFAFAMAPCGVRSNLSGNGRFGLPQGNIRTLGEFVSVEFDASKDRMAISYSRNHKVRNVSPLNLTLNSGKKLQAWIDYVADSRRLEVRLSKAGSSRPLDPLLADWIDLWEMWDEREVFWGLSSSSRSSNQSCLIYSWSFSMKVVPHWIHSQPLDPNAISEEESEPLRVHDKKKDCLPKVLAAMIFGAGSGALGAFCILYLWTIFGNRRPVKPEKIVVGKEKQQLDCEYKKVEVVVIHKTIKEDGRLGASEAGS